MTTSLTEITVVGEDSSGIVASVTSQLFERQVNIEDIDQAVRDGMFRMTLRADTSEMVCTEATLKRAFDSLADELGVDIQVRFPTDRQTGRIAAMVTKESHCLESILRARVDGQIDAKISIILGNHSKLEPLAERYGIPFVDIGNENGVPDEDEILDVLDAYEIDLIVLARYMRILSPKVVFRYEDRIINVHPSLLPSFPGAKAYRQAREEGVRIAGVTAHYVTTDLDQGPVIAQRAFNIPDDASVEAIRTRGQPLEAEALLEAIQLHLDQAVTVHRGRTSLREQATTADYQLGFANEHDSALPREPTDNLSKALENAPQTVPDYGVE